MGKHKGKPPDNPTYRLNEKHLKRRIKKALDKIDEEIRSDEQHPVVFAIKREITNKIIKRLEETVHRFKKDYEKWLLRNKGKFVNLKWIKKNVAIRNNLQEKKHEHLLPIVDYMSSHTLSYKESCFLGDKIRAGVHKTTTKKGEYEERIYILIKIDKENIGIKLGISPSLVYKYVKEMERVGIIKKLGRDGSRGKVLYAMGTFQIFEDPKEDWTPKPRRLWFLNKETRGMLVEFNIKSNKR
ncbi:MAG: hypothetical protein ACYSTS_17585 [Planctomycetota bacterium]|jgi:hypothetical protein